MAPKAKAPAKPPAKVRSRAAAPPAVAEAQAGPWPTPPWTLEERLQRIAAMGERISDYVQYICQVGSLNGSSAEAKERAVAAFYDRLVVAEGQLGRIQEELRLG
jgi:hypothetical protein